MTQAAQRAMAIGAMAQEALASENCAWRVLASVNGAIYIQSEQDRLLWITDRGSALHPRAVVVGQLGSPMPAAGSTCSADRGILHFDSAWTVELENASCWKPQWSIQSFRRLGSYLGRIEDVLADTARRLPPLGGFAAFLPFLGNVNPGGWIEKEILDRAREAIRGCKDALAGMGLSSVVESCRDLIGLGSGLTPSGDDFLSAYLFTMRASEIVYGIDLSADWQRIRTSLQREAARTNRISSALLLDCADGIAAEPLHEFVNAVLTNIGMDELVSRACRLARIGHSSGWDLLVGVHAAICSLRAQEHNVTEMEQMDRHAVCRKEVARVR